MSGHNKWSKIKHKKAVTDAKKSKEFTKLNRLLKIEAKNADGNVDSPGLKRAIEKAKGMNMPKDNIDRAIKSVFDSDTDTYQSVLYETYGPGGVAILISAITDNTNRTAGEIKHILSKAGFALASPGSAKWAFNQEPDGSFSPQSTTALSKEDEEKLESLLETLDDQDDVDDIYTNAE